MKKERKILVILGHPNKESLNKLIADSYISGAKDSGAKVEKIYLYDLKFDPILHKGYKEKQELEPDLKKAQDLIKWADHIVWIFPIWWGSMPALLKGFIDRAILPGFAFKYMKNFFLPKRLLKGKTTSMIITTGGPTIIYFFLKRIMLFPINFLILRFVGLKIKRIKLFGGIRDIKEEKLKNIIKKTKTFGKKTL